MTKTCPSCGHDSETTYRCDDCGRDLAGVGPSNGSQSAIGGGR